MGSRLRSAGESIQSSRIVVSVIVSCIRLHLVTDRGGFGGSEAGTGKVDAEPSTALAGKDGVLEVRKFNSRLFGI